MPPSCLIGETQIGRTEGPFWPTMSVVQPEKVSAASHEPPLPNLQSPILTAPGRDRFIAKTKGVPT